LFLSTARFPTFNRFSLYRAPLCRLGIGRSSRGTAQLECDCSRQAHLPTWERRKQATSEVDMSACASCGSNLAEETRFCNKCGSQVGSKSLTEASRSKTIEIMPPPVPTWYVTLATGQRGGPFTEDAIQGMIARQQIKITDSVVAAGGSTWVPITQSPFARYIVTQTSVDRLAASTCPRCGAAMAVVTKKSTMATILILVGIISSIFLIGVVLIIVGVMMRRKVKVAYQCPRCNYRT